MTVTPPPRAPATSVRLTCVVRELVLCEPDDVCAHTIEEILTVYAEQQR
jgi:hypothetical protein